MSSFYCPKCNALCSDTEYGYISGCRHFPADMSIEEYNSRMGKIIDVPNKKIHEMLIALLDEANKYTICSSLKNGKSVKSGVSKRKKGKHEQKVSKVVKRVRK